ncbi:hypothetical protein EDB83DRAFT_2675282 [Lactarius deliciosus]|nr:hypothetical protein EDB83DRAFT_2675282 [Lactarius deliciosus]
MGIGVDAVWGFELDLNSPLSDPAAGCDDAASARARFILGTYNGSNSIILSVDIKKLILFLNSSIHPATVEQDSVLPQRWAQEIPSLHLVIRFTKTRRRQAQTFVARVASGFPLHSRLRICCVRASAFQQQQYEGTAVEVLYPSALHLMLDAHDPTGCCSRPAGRGGWARAPGGYAVRFALNEIEFTYPVEAPLPHDPNLTLPLPIPALEPSLALHQRSAPS